MRRKRGADFDDGRVIAPMNIDGMPWYSAKVEQRGETAGSAAPVKLTFRENMAFAFGVLKAVLLIAVVFIGVMFAFILFCTNVWFR